MSGQSIQDWELKPMGSVCQIVNGGTPKTGVSEYWDGENCWITPAEMGKRAALFANSTQRKLTVAGLQNSSATLLPPYSVILSSRAPIGHLVINTVPMATNQGCKGLIPSPEMHFKFLYYFLEGSVEHLNELGSGATFKELSGGKLKEVLVPVPPLPEQERIVAILDEAFANIAIAKTNTEEALKKAREFFDSQLNDLTALHDCSRTTLGDIAEFRNGVNFTKTSSGQRVAVVGVKDFKNDFWVNERGLEFAILDSEMNDLDQLVEGDILTVRSNGSADLIGRTLLAPSIEGTTTHSGFVIRIRLTSGKFEPSFVCWYLKASRVRTILTEGGTGTNIKSLNQKSLAQLEIPILPVEEQKQCVAAIWEAKNKIEELERLVNKKISALDELKKSLLHQAFSGQL